MIPRRYVLRAMLYSVCVFVGVALIGLAFGFATNYADGNETLYSAIGMIGLTSISIGWGAFMITVFSVGNTVLLRDPWFRRNSIERFPIMKLAMWREVLEPDRDGRS